MQIKRPIVALDFPTAELALGFLQQFPQDESLFVKVGMELYYSAGQDLIQRLIAQGHTVFLDLKCHDIPHTVERVMRVLGKLGVQMTTTHALGGLEMLKAAQYGLVEGALQAGKAEPQLLAITQLTSTDEQMARTEQLISVDLAESVTAYAQLAAQAGLAGVVCSGWEAAGITKATRPDFLRVTPGIRLTAKAQDDQKRVMTPELAAKNQASAIVVGRPMTKAQDPVETYRMIYQRWNQKGK